MYIDFNKPVKELTPEEAIYLAQKAKSQGQVLENTNVLGGQTAYYDYPKYIAELGLTVSSEAEEKEARKNAKPEPKQDEKQDNKHEVKKLDNK